jgi:hypothetical protein
MGTGLAFSPKPFYLSLALLYEVIIGDKTTTKTTLRCMKPIIRYTAEDLVSRPSKSFCDKFPLTLPSRL